MTRKKRYFFYPVFIFFFTSLVWCDEVRILTCEEAPTNYRHDGELMGTTIDIVEEMKRSLGIENKIEVFPCARAYAYAQKRSDVIFFTCAMTQERINEGFHFIGPVITREHVLWKKKGSDISITSIHDIKEQDLTVGSMVGEWRGKFFQDRNIRVFNEYSHESNAQKLMKGRIDLWALSDIEALSVLKRAGYSLEDVELAYTIKRSSSYILISKDMDMAAIRKWETAFGEILKNQDFLKKLEEKWSRILGAKLVFLEKKGVVVSKEAYH